MDIKDEVAVVLAGSATFLGVLIMGISLFITSEAGNVLIKRFEGLELSSYLCPAKVWTIGYGHTKTAKPGQKITVDEANSLLKQDLKVYEDAVKRYVRVPLTQNQFDALVSFTYNLGGGALKKSTLLKLLNKKDYEGASKEFSKWVKAGGKTLNGLVKRREAERRLFTNERS